MKSASHHPSLSDAIPPTVLLPGAWQRSGSPFSTVKQPGEFWLLDLCCNAGGAGYGYMTAGFKVIGIDIEPQPRYPSLFIHADALQCDYEFLSLFDAIHASPPCQNYCTVNNHAKKRGKTYLDLIEPFRQMLIASGKPFIMENVPSAPLRPDICLSGTMFGLGVIRRRIFETNTPIRKADDMLDIREGLVKNGDYITVAGSGEGSQRLSDWRRAMGIPWMNRDEIKESIPPAFTYWIGQQLVSILRGAAQDYRCEAIA